MTVDSNATAENSKINWMVVFCQNTKGFKKWTRSLASDLPSDFPFVQLEIMDGNRLKSRDAKQDFYTMLHAMKLEQSSLRLTPEQKSIEMKTVASSAVTPNILNSIRIAFSVGEDVPNDNFDEWKTEISKEFKKKIGIEPQMKTYASSMPTDIFVRVERHRGSRVQLNTLVRKAKKLKDTTNCVVVLLLFMLPSFENFEDSVREGVIVLRVLENTSGHPFTITTTKQHVRALAHALSVFYPAVQAKWQMSPSTGSTRKLVTVSYADGSNVFVECVTVFLNNLFSNKKSIRFLEEEYAFWYTTKPCLLIVVSAQHEYRMEWDGYIVNCVQQALGKSYPPSGLKNASFPWIHAFVRNAGNLRPIIRPPNQNALLDLVWNQMGNELTALSHPELPSDRMPEAVLMQSIESQKR